MTDNAITVDVAHVRGLWAYGPGWALMWDGYDAVITRPEAGDDGQLLEIGTYESIRGMRDALAEEGEAHDDATIAGHLTDITGDYAGIWDDIGVLMPLTLPYTTALAAHGIRRWGQGNTCGGHQIIQSYQSPSGAREFEITIPATPDTPLIIEQVLMTPTGAYDRKIHIATVPADTPPADVAALIAAARIARTPTPVTLTPPTSAPTLM